MKKIIFLLFIILLFSCENKSDTDGSLYTNVCKREVFEMPEYFEPTAINSLIIDGEYIYVNGFYEDDKLFEPRTYKYDRNGQNLGESDIELNTNTQDYNVGDSELITVDEVFGDTGREKIIIKKIIDGEEVFSVDVDNIFGMSVKDLPIDYIGDNYFQITGVVASDGIYYIAGGSKIAVLDSNGNKIALINVSGEAVKLLTYENDVLVLINNTNTRKFTINYIDKINNKIGDKLDMPNELLRENLQAKIISGNGYDFYIKNSVGLYGCNIGAEPVEVVNWINSDTIGSDISLLEILSPTEFVYISIEYYGNNSRRYEAGKFTVIPKDEYVEKKILTLAKMHEWVDVEWLVVNFNKNNDEYRVVIKDYSLYDEEVRDTMLNADIAAGNIPDLFAYFHNAYDEIYPLQSYKDQGLFVDLLEMFERDEDISADILNDIVLNAFTIDGKMYALPTDFGVSDVFIGKKSNFPFSTWTPREMIEYSESLSADQMLVLNNAVYSHVWDYGILEHYVDYENKVVTFDDEYKQLMKYRAEALGKIDRNAVMDDLSRAEREALIRSGKLLLERTAFFNFNTLFQYKYLFGGEITLIGAPAMTGSGSTITNGETYCMSSKSKYPDGAWGFLKHFILLDSETDQRDMISSLPITRAGLENHIENVLKVTIAYSGNFSRTYSNPMTEADIEDYENNASEHELITLTREEVDAIMAILSAVRQDYVIDTEVWDIFREEILPYYDNPTDEVYDNCMRVIKNRIELYLNEKY